MRSGCERVRNLVPPRSPNFAPRAPRRSRRRDVREGQLSSPGRDARSEVIFAPLGVQALFRNRPRGAESPPSGLPRVLVVDGNVYWKKVFRVRNISRRPSHIWEHLCISLRSSSGSLQIAVSTSPSYISCEGWEGADIRRGRKVEEGKEGRTSSSKDPDEEGEEAKEE